MRILSGVQSSGKQHLGNYYGAIRQFVELQSASGSTGLVENLYFIANLHALNSIRDPILARQLTKETAAAFVALGVNPKTSILFRQSDIPEVSELYWILGTVVPVSNLERAHSYRDKIENQKITNPDFGLFAYPVLMAADILLYDSDVVPVGKDQKQHLEFTRDWATKFNVQYVKGYDPQKPDKKPGVFKLPNMRIQEATQSVTGRDGQKMSKSYNNTIDLFGTDGELDKQIKSIKTDSTLPAEPKPTADSPLYELLKLILPSEQFVSVDAQWKSGGKGYGDFKKELLASILSQFGDARKHYAELMQDDAQLESILQDGASRARALAAPVMKRVRDAVGL
jgi:tryptophanyl-tRNA synthetase